MFRHTKLPKRGITSSICCSCCMNIHIWCMYNYMWARVYKSSRHASHVFSSLIKRHNEWAPYFIQSFLTETRSFHSSHHKCNHEIMDNAQKRAFLPDMQAHTQKSNQPNWWMATMTSIPCDDCAWANYHQHGVGIIGEHAYTKTWLHGDVQHVEHLFTWLAINTS